MAIEVRRHCKECQTNFTAALPEKPQPGRALTCPNCGTSIPDPSNQHAASPVREERHPVSGARQTHLF